MLTVMVATTIRIVGTPMLIVTAATTIRIVGILTRTVTAATIVAAVESEAFHKHFQRILSITDIIR